MSVAESDWAASGNGRVPTEPRPLAETIASYDRHASFFADRYAAVDLGPYYEAFVGVLPLGGRAVLDAGCGSGRDCAAFERRGVAVVGLDRSSGLLALASQSTSAPLVHGDMRRLPFREACFGGVWACASLVHFSPDEALGVFSEFRRVLVPDGAVFASVAHGSGNEWRPDPAGGRRWFQYYDQASVEELASAAGLTVISAKTEPGAAAGRWVNLLARLRGS